MHLNLTSQIILVDDDPDIAIIMQLLLAEKGHQVHVLESVEPGQALALNASLIILDQKLPYQSGSELCKGLKNDPASSFIPVLLCSAANDLPVLKERCGADAYIAKPFSIDEFMELVERLLS